MIKNKNIENQNEKINWSTQSLCLQYYTKTTPSVSDSEYDQLYPGVEVELKPLILMRSYQSPTHRVGEFWF